MKSKIFIIFFISSLINCHKKTENTDYESTKISERISYSKKKNHINIHSGKFWYKIPTYKLPFKRVILLNSSLMGYFLEINKEKNIIGITSPEYIFSEKIKKLIQQNKIKNVGNEQKYNIEKILALKPDVIFTNYIETFENTYYILKKNGIEVIFIDEYLEQRPLDKAKILKLFGVLLGAEAESNYKFKYIEQNYKKLVYLASKQREKPVSISNEMYGNQWFMPMNQTFSARYFEAAGSNYILKNINGTTSIPLTFEEVLLKSKNATIWVNVGDHRNKWELLNLNHNYLKINTFKNGKIYSMAGATNEKANDIFESGAVRVDLVLKDYIKIFHPNLLPNHRLYYMKEVK